MDKDINMKVVFNLLQIFEVGGLLAQLVLSTAPVLQRSWVNLNPAFIVTSFSPVQIYDFHLFTVVYSPLHGFIWNQLDNQLPVGLLAQLVEHCTGIAEVLDSNPIQA